MMLGNYFRYYHRIIVSELKDKLVKLNEKVSSKIRTELTKIFWKLFKKLHFKQCWIFH